ncbi:chitin synthase [Mycena floridula]|nr:chitin synthase [Mycena floridula]
MASSSTTTATTTGQLTDLVSSSTSAKIYPNAEQLLSVLHARFRSDLPYTRLGDTSLVVVNPYKTLASLSDASRTEYLERSYRSTAPAGGLDAPRPLQPHVYDFACRVYLVMRRGEEGANQAVVATGPTSSSKTHTLSLLTSQLLTLSSHSQKESKLALQIRAAETVLSSFAHAKTASNPHASRHNRLTELHFTAKGRLSGAKILLFGLDKSRLGRLSHEERTFHVFYEVLAGATTTERDALALEDPSEYALLRSSGTYRLPAGQFSDDAVNMGILREALRTLGFKPKVMSKIWEVVNAVLLLGNLEFEEGDAADVPAYVVNTLVLDQVARHLGVEPQDLGQALTTKSSYVKKELYTVILDKAASIKQRDALTRDLYAILVAFVIESVNNKIFKEEGDRKISMLDHAGWQSRATGTLVSDKNGFEEFFINYGDERVRAWIVQQRFSEDEDGIARPTVAAPDVNLEVLDTAVVALQKVKKGIDVHSSLCGALPPSSTLPTPNFSVVHYTGPTTYSCEGWKEKESDRLDAAFVDSFIAKLFSGPSLMVEYHAKDSSVPVNAQVSSMPLRLPVPLDVHKTHGVSQQLSHSLTTILDSLPSSLWTIMGIRPNDSASPNSFDRKRVKAQIINSGLAEYVARMSVEYPVSVPHAEFCERYVPTMRGEILERISQCARANGWVQDKDYVVGRELVHLSYDAWKIVEDPIRAVEKAPVQEIVEPDVESMLTSHDNLLPPDMYGDGGLHTPTEQSRGTFPSEFELVPPTKQDSSPRTPVAPVEEIPTTRTRRLWLILVWLNTFWIPNFLLSSLGRMKRPDIRLAWREKVTIFMLIFLLNAIVIFYIVEFGRLLCPSFDKVWASNEVAQHTGTDDIWVSVQGVVYDVSNFIHGDHSDLPNEPSNGADSIDQLAGQDLTYYFPVPLTLGCPDLVDDPGLVLTLKNATIFEPTAIHTSGTQQSNSNTKLKQNDWYTSTFLPKMRGFRKGPLVWSMKDIQAQALDTDIAKVWAVYESNLFDLTDYINSITIASTDQRYQFLNSDIVDLFKQQSGQDITKPLGAVLSSLDPNTRAQNINCLKNVFFIGQVDIRKTARCQAQNYILLVLSGIMMASMGLKFLAALQLTSKRTPELQDKFVLCQVPCYTEGEDSLRRTIDSLAALEYDDKRKLIFIICDGNIIGAGNDRTTPRIVLDILGIDPSLDPEPLLFKSVGEGARALNYGKVYSGLYEFEGHVVPYVVIVKVGKPTERSKPGNRGKRDSQILLLHYLNRVHFDAEMSPLELELYHQMRNVIGIEPSFYEYIFTVDADTVVTPTSLNRLVAASASDSSIIGICGETKLDNEETSWWTMIQVYEYYISHHLSKAFESLFGSVTCLPGCFSLYRIRTADKGRPIIISNRIIDEYAEPNVDTLHKKNLFSLGEDRFLTTLLMKHFPLSWRILFSQRRRWINSTVHNLCELVMLPELFGFCCFSMRFFVFIDLLSTMILPATVVYLAYLIIVVALGDSALPTLALIMLAVVYGLQAIIFILKREFMLIGWMVVYILSYPVYSFFLPVYSFWCMDEFGWGNTRLVIGEGKEKKVLMSEEDKFDESMIPLRKFSEYEAEAWDTKSRAPSPHTYHQSSQAGDYYRDTNLRAGSQVSLSNLSHQPPASRQSPYGQAPGFPQQPGYGQNAYSQAFVAPQLPFMPFGGGPGSAAGSDYGGRAGSFGHGSLGNQPTGSFQGHGQMGSFGPPGAEMFPQNTGMSGFMPGAAANPFASVGSFAAPNLTGGSFGPGGSFPPTAFAPPNPSFGARPMSTFSMATSVSPFAGPSMNPNPTDDEVIGALRHYLAGQDLMQVTKKTAREAMAARFPKADLASRKEFLNHSIDTILSEA